MKTRISTYNKIQHFFAQQALHIAVLFVLGLCLLGIQKTSATRQWGNFLNQDFWNQNPNTGNIIYALYGDGSTGSTPYTRNWTTSCIPSSVQYLSPSYAGGNLNLNNTIYILTGGSYTLNSNISLNGNCVAIVGRGNVTIDANGHSLITNIKKHIIIDNIQIHNGLSGAIYLSSGYNITLNTIQGYQNTQNGMVINDASFVSINNSQFYDNTQQGILLTHSPYITFNNILSYNNAGNGIQIDMDSPQSTINNSQFFNNTNGISIQSRENIIHNSLVYNNNGYGISINPSSFTGVNYLNNTSLYNNSNGLYLSTGELDLFGTIKFFENTTNTGGAGIFERNPGSLSLRNPAIAPDTSFVSPDFDRVTNPKNGSGSFLLNGTNIAALQGTQTFDTSKRPIRYIFGLNILKQDMPVTSIPSGPIFYGLDSLDYISTKYIGEQDPSFNTTQMSLINQYFGSGSTYTENRETNACSLGAFQTVSLAPGTYSSTTYLQDHTIYLLTGGEYRCQVGRGANCFVLSGNCIAIVGTSDTKIDKNSSNVNNIFYANNQHNIIFDSLKIDGKYQGNFTPSNIGISLDGSSNNNTINNIQVYNQKQYGIFLGIGSHHNSIINTQTFNTLGAGIYLYLASNYNVINNTQTFNNSGYGIRFANGSNRNAMNNFQAYNNTIGIFGDMTTKNNIINRAMLYNNSQYGLYLKNSSGNIFNDIMIFNNDIGAKLEFGSVNNLYQGEFKVFDNLVADFTGTDGNDGNLSAGSTSPFSAGTLTLGSNLMDCSYVTNPNLSGSTTYFLTGTLCDHTGTSFGVFTGQDIQYLFGPNVYLQTTPVKYDISNAIIQLSTQYDPTKYIAEVFPILDETPENISFLSTGNYQLTTPYISNVYTASIINTPVPITLTMLPTGAVGYLIINGAPQGLTGTIINGDTIQIGMTSSPGFTQTTTGTVTIGLAAPTTVTLTTRGPNELPTAFTFNNITNTDIDTYETTNTITVSGLETGVTASITFTPASLGWLVVHSGSSVYSGTSNLIIHNGNQIEAVVKSSFSYGATITGDVTIGLRTGNFIVQTALDTNAPIITFTDDVNQEHRSDTIVIDFVGANALQTYTFVSDPLTCTGGMSMSGMITYTTGFTLSGHAHNGEYICAYGEDTSNNITTEVSSDPLQTSDIYFTDAVESIAVAYDNVSITYPNTMISKYALVTTTGDCTLGLVMNTYTGSLLFTTTGSNGQYVCAYGEDDDGSGKFIISPSSLHIDPTLPSLHFVDDVSSGAVASDTIVVGFSGANFVSRLYKFVSSSSDCNATGATNYTTGIVVSNETYNGKHFCAYGTDTSGHQLSLVSYYPLHIDHTSPSTPLPSYPANDEEVYFLTLEYNSATDTGSGIKGYHYEISDDHNFSEIIDSDFVETTGNSFSPTDFTEVDGDYYWRIQAEDNLGLTSSRSAVASFTAVDNPDFFFDEVTNAARDTYYDSAEFSINGLGQNSTVWATVTDGSIYKNGHDKGDSTTVQDDDIISIHLKSSEDYHDSVSSTLTIANRSTDFMITTLHDSSSCSISNEDKELIQMIFSGLMHQFSGNQNTYTTFLSTMTSMLQDQIDLTDDCNLQYLQDLINGNVTGQINNVVNTGNHIAPSCKEYRISYDSTKRGYTSPDFKAPAWYATRDSLTRFIDNKNPGDCHIVTNILGATRYFTNTDPNRHVAPNGKIYTLQHSTNGYTSPDLSTTKYFTTLATLRGYLDAKNPPLDIWSHTVDNSFQPVTFTAPNSKAYTIYKTSRGYMSYKLLKVKYYSTLQAIESFISKNNAK